MSHVAGIVVRPPRLARDHPLTREILRSLGRGSEHELRVFEHGATWAAKVDMGAFGAPGAHEEDDGSFSLLCGDPIVEIGNTGPSRNRSEDARRLHRGVPEDATAWLRSTRGVFSLVHAPRRGASVILATDHLGIRPLYLWSSPEVVVFSSRLLLIQEMLDLGLCPRGAVEFAGLGYPLGRRTAVRDVVRLAAAEILEVDPDLQIRSRRYWDWSCAGVERTEVHGGGARGEAGEPEVEEVDAAIFREFQRGVDLRLGSDRRTVAYLSGGLDSRAIVALLRSRNAFVRTFNFSTPGQQDHLFGDRMADALGTDHTFVPRRMPVELWKGDWSFLLRRSWNPLHPTPGADVERPRLVWSGDGGSVAVGGSSALSDEIAFRMQSGDLDGAARSYAPRLPAGILGPRRAEAFGDVIPTGVLEELEALPHPDPLRQFHLFLLVNDQRRHLDGHFETLDLHGLEFHLPFFDFAFLKKLAAVPMERLRKHGFYHAWLSHFPEIVRTVPWQTYPSHLPCPVPQVASSPDQWSADQRSVVRSQRRRSRQRFRSRFARMALSRHFPEAIVHRPRFLVAGTLDLLGIRNYDYAVDFVYRLFIVNRARARGRSTRIAGEGTP